MKNVCQYKGFHVVFASREDASHVARGNQRRAPVLRTDTHYFRYARMLRTLHSKNKNVCQYKEFHVVFCFARDN